MTAQCPPQQSDAFRDLARIFAGRYNRVLEFEILPPAIGPLLEDNGSIGITKAYLAEAFVTARQIFFDSLTFRNSLDSQAASSDHLLSEQESQSQSEIANRGLTVASEIILLFDCEHLTACNWRKRRLRILSSDRLKLLEGLQTELSLMTTYLCSPLHRHTKSPTLWQHRQWVQSHFMNLRDSTFMSVYELFNAELALSLRAAELHPRNYYAFTYMRHVHRIMSEAGGGQSTDWSIQLARSVVGSMTYWCTSHPADISGLMYLLYLLDAVPDTELRLETASRVVSFALKIGWEGESLWTFIDLAICKFSLFGSLEDVSAYPWGVFRDPLSLVGRDGEGGMSWRKWLDRARVHWAHLVQPQTLHKPNG
ncbi:uncharacterized protein BDV17DRAFT_57913 [Aspergillus undulatus]|uniref:uncharacterized protein n=1 Tax=Aspergillus undulatus TaxID=1810928 RepID=UPI003CCD4C06